MTPFKKLAMIAGFATAVAATMPAISQARSHYTGKTPASIAMMASPFQPMEPAGSEKHVVKASKHSKVSKLAKHKTKKHKKHKALSKKTKA